MQKMLSAPPTNQDGICEARTGNFRCVFHWEDENHPYTLLSEHPQLWGRGLLANTPIRAESISLIYSQG